jgi:hypothetical protein
VLARFNDQIHDIGRDRLDFSPIDEHSQIIELVLLANFALGWLVFTHGFSILTMSARATRSSSGIWSDDLNGGPIPGLAALLNLF